MSSARNIVLFLIFLLISVGLGLAAEVRVLWPKAEAENATQIMSREEARQEGFAMAVKQAALDLLPESLEPDRVELLGQYLAPRAGDYILSYSETGEERDPVRTLILEVKVNRQALKQTLKRLGVFYTVSQPQSFDLRLSGGAQAFWEEIGRLTRLSGLTVEDGSEPRLLLGLNENATLIGTLSAGGREWQSSSKDMELLWVDLWGKWFTRPEAEEGVFQEAVLIVSGWFTPDGVRAFDQRIAGWEQEVESAVLAQVEMLPGGITARWRVRTLDMRSLEQRLSAYLLDRGLSYAFEEVPDAAPQADALEIKNPGAESPRDFQF